MRISRLFEIVYLLLDKKRVSAGELAERFGVSKRTIFRDIEVLSEAGIPVYASQGKGGGLSLVETFVLDKSVLTEKEQAEILGALHGIAATGLSEAEGVLSRLEALFRRRNRNWLEVDFSPWGASEERRASFDILRDAVLEGRRVSFDYFSDSGSPTPRRAEPIKLYFKHRAWYLYAWCLDAGAPRTFKISRLSGLRLTGEQGDAGRHGGTPPPDPPEPPRIDLELLLRPEAAARVVDEFEAGQIAGTETGSFLVRASLPRGEWLYGYLLSFGPSLAGLEPPELRRELLGRVEALKKNLENLP